MKFKCAVLLYILLILTITRPTFGDATDGNELFSMSQEEQDKCGLYTYKIFKPLLRYKQEMKDKIEDNVVLQSKVTQLQQMVSESVLKDQLLDSTSVYIKDLKSQILDFHETLTYYKKIIDQLANKYSLSIAHKIDQLVTLKCASYKKELDVKTEKIDKLNNQIIELTKQLNKDAVKSVENENQNSTRTTLNGKDEILNNFNIQAKNDSILLHETQDCENKLNNLEPKVSCLSFKDCPGIHQIKVPGIDKFDVLCDSKTAGPGWIVIQQRINGKEDFYRNWTTYREGFGSFDGDFFLGLEKIHRLTNNQQHQLYIYIEPFEKNTYYASYDHFAISGEADQYRLINADGYSGSAEGDYLEYHIAKTFHTFDRDNQNNCARKRHGGWWYGKCAASNLNGKYYGQWVNNNTTNYWNRLTANKKVQMLIRPKEN